MTVEIDQARLAAAEGLEEARSVIEGQRAALERLAHWRPRKGLMAQCDEALAMINAMQSRMKRKLVVSLLGPTGAGKSTLLNALAGVDRLSEVGTGRPTTRHVVVFCRDRSDAEPLMDALGRERVQVVSSQAAAALEHVILVDTPDTNSMMLSEHRPLVEAVIAQSDVLVCVFHAENPKSRENIDYLAPFVAMFPSELVLAVLNHCDRQDQGELEREILPDFENHLIESWAHPVAGTFCTSARRHLRHPDWPAGAEPRHGFDQFPALREMIYGSYNRANLVVDARLKRARFLADLVVRRVRERVVPLQGRLGELRDQVEGLHREALVQAGQSLGEGSSLASGFDAVLYQRLASRWWGPVGWLVGLWARTLMVGSGIANLLRFGNPLRQFMGALSSLSHLSKSRAAIEQASQGLGLEGVMVRYQLVVQRQWPDLAEALIEVGFDPEVRETSGLMPDSTSLDEALSREWEAAFTASVEQSARRLSGWIFQTFLNLWVIVPLGVVVVQCLYTWVLGQYLSDDYFRQTLVIIFLMWALSFVAFQVRARGEGGSRLLARTLDRLLEGLQKPSEGMGQGWVLKELRQLQAMSRSDRA